MLDQIFLLSSMCVCMFLQTRRLSLFSCCPVEKQEQTTYQHRLRIRLQGFWKQTAKAIFYLEPFKHKRIKWHDVECAMCGQDTPGLKAHPSFQHLASTPSLIVLQAFGELQYWFPHPKFEYLDLTRVGISAVTIHWLPKKNKQQCN